MSSHNTAIQLDGLTKTYGGKNVVDHLSFEVPRGTICGFIGPNGAGKTTTIRMLLGLIAPSGGQATVLGHAVSDPASYLGRVGAMIEGPAFYPTLSGKRNLDVLATLAGIDRKRVELAIAEVGLGERADDLYRTYSLGMKQRLGIAAAMLPEPELLILDEPINGLDPPGIREVRTLLRSLADRGTSVLVSSHLLDELQQISDNVVIIRKGNLLFSGPVADLVASRQPVLLAVPEQADDMPRLAELSRDAGYPARVRDGRLEVSAPVPWIGELNRRSMAAGITLIELMARTQTLEDVYFELTGEIG